MRITILLALVFPAVTIGCSSSSSPPSTPSPDASVSAGNDASAAPPVDGSPGPVSDATAADSSKGPLLTCTPAPGFAGNSKNVGGYCTKGGGQCSTYANSSAQCSIDLSTQGSNFCIVIGCSQDTDCGEEACCTGQAGNPIKACVPNGCFDGGVCKAISP